MIYDTQEARQIDEWARTSGLPLEVLMERAGSHIATRIKERHRKTERILILCGTGNNGGDGYVIGRELIRDGFDVTLFAPFGENRSDTSIVHVHYAEAFGLVTEQPCGQYDVILDALYGTGFDPKRMNQVFEAQCEFVSEQKQQGARIYAVDVPSGVPTDHATEFKETAIRADVTFQLHAMKRSAFLIRTARFYGESEIIDIGLPTFGEWRVSPKDVTALFKREPYGHKGTYGTALLIGGSETMPGSIQLATRAALRTGVGKLQVATTALAKHGIIAQAPEAMVIDQTLPAIQEMLPSISAVGIGPGLSQEAVETWVDHLLESDVPVVLDAAALVKESYPERTAPIIVTPHIGEFARMMNQSVASIQDDLFGQATDYAILHQVTVVLKSHVILIAKPDGGGFVISGASSGLAKGGSGDTLFGILTSLLAQHPTGDIEQTLAQGAEWYARASRQVERRLHPSSLLATDVIEELGRVEL
ncbi:bifunctional ADP-dependent NAD(P)H-hydrate dehydratase/NAD(P)H-hydrate epimerase [Exiguobacterium acetylicum]|uniref:bifunctional ADP-dependent NAD(P)H-hydrate dehydratase/NAD(P)H-hydrate epimerase n=1 Tax=Exiguobacterium acetylicum TaxID=41170 RepID=UPI0006813EB7|nr:bifunctional ADP-dependent NAD(P)H-hydrate dehydratase/NAD(P)H-hydrate epimerase [Exiguobacterium acetylicum]KNH33948.1 carbohydrate kinase [Exiguobacterium acetylicum]